MHAIRRLEVVDKRTSRWPGQPLERVLFADPVRVTLSYVDNGRTLVVYLNEGE
jgi:hypothetical protein